MFSELWELLNNAGIATKTGPIEWFGKRDLEEILSVNLLGLIDVTVTFLPLIKKARGRIVNTSSIAGRLSVADLALYSVSKYGIEAFSDSIRQASAFYLFSIRADLNFSADLDFESVLRPGCVVVELSPGVRRQVGGWWFDPRLVK